MPVLYLETLFLHFYPTPRSHRHGLFGPFYGAITDQDRLWFSLPLLLNKLYVKCMHIQDVSCNVIQRSEQMRC